MNRIIRCFAGLGVGESPSSVLYSSKKAIKVPSKTKEKGYKKTKQNNGLRNKKKTTPVKSFLRAEKTRS